MAVLEVFMDTAGFLALWDGGDEHHERAVTLQAELVAKKRRFVTTDYVLDETITLLLVRHSHACASDFLRSVLESASLRVEWMDSEHFRAAAEIFCRHSDKNWSFTDCVSFVLMRALKIREAFTTDRHFGQAGFNSLLKQ